MCRDIAWWEVNEVQIPGNKIEPQWPFLDTLNLEDPRIAEGLEISLKVMQKMNKYAVARNIRLLVVLIPTKETVFRNLWQSPSRSYSNLTENEERFWRATKDFLEQNGIEYLDSWSVLQEQLAAGIQPY
jgi:hypothetical protein